jgi:rare lipoprotein A
MKWPSILPIGLSALTLSSCALLKPATIKDGAPRTFKDISKIKQPKPHYLPKSRYGNPPSYKVNGVTYHVLTTTVGYNERGIASWYGSKFTNRLTSTREPYDPYKITAASPVLPIPCFARVTNLENGRSIIVKVNDRGPFASNRIIDLSYAAAIKLGYEKKGTALVDVATINVKRPYNLLNMQPIVHSQLYIQVGAFSELSNADDLKNQIQQLTHQKTRIKIAQANHRLLYRVQVGPINSVTQAHQIQIHLLHAGIGKPFNISAAKA